MIKIGEKGAGANGANGAIILIVFILFFIDPMDIRLGVQDMIDTS